MNRQEVIESVVDDQLKPADAYPAFGVGDTLNVHVRIIEGDKERIQVYQGVLIADKGRGVNRMITVRRIVANEGVERVFPLHSPRIAKIDVVRRGDARRAKLYFLRKRVGKSRGELNSSQLLVAKAGFAAVAVPFQRSRQPSGRIVEHSVLNAEGQAFRREQGTRRVTVVVARKAVVLARPGGHFLRQVGNRPAFGAGLLRFGRQG